MNKSKLIPNNIIYLNYGKNNSKVIMRIRDVEFDYKYTHGFKVSGDILYVKSIFGEPVKDIWRWQFMSYEVYDKNTTVDEILLIERL